MKHRVPEVLQTKCRHFFEQRWPDEEPLEINPYKLKVLTGLGQGTCLKLFNDQLYVPDSRVMDVLCNFFDLQPGDFLYHERAREPARAGG
ncbi:helix-turn-helix transcriptional regulator [Kamptonema animale CS-326]|uniref:helix-turn-helix domain-containing protein n=1 Tax=Kamptonema animale TaxID=92934 RepID=UPI00232FDFE0|nr:helix-turn-helix transcriptional regulator [Kamptonema animale]MDB9514783.1 helix-turn-helix transcriptional regulator [Kamptonema animale CS-326]